MFGKRDENGEGRPLPKERYSFDELTRGVASGEITRSRALKVLAGGALAALFGWGIVVEEAEARCNGNFCRGDTKRCGPNRDCVCYKTPGGGRVCAADTGDCESCNEDRDCPRGFRCVQNGNQCCGGRFRFVCAAPCEGGGGSMRSATDAGSVGWPGATG